MGPYYEMFPVSMTRLNILYKTQINNGGEFLKYRTQSKFYQYPGICM